ncbi:5,6-dimethylbenzimidazole synthase [Streptomyces pluripotens]|uniref:Nicotinate-nucleotide--dimethylbenzimidazole phosphoribosyltransferase n=1 Tax=Streptomyces pluripotens TaxID=1355015 RepID=A0A221NVM8_9ACTN|nr:nicotinate-nucleotide--dimethylbenzimidazole phosphoribosyltransferase [Streptomyces pluripotens]ARP69336.1 5,6-dimethylbenzimidazole synthase [Streptomyces pluripotens]ASN23595.1 5,6-dimethylbenzimidazole synthase [Streptomyces pluripotens]
MTDTGQVPGEGQPESAGMVEQPGVPAHGAYTYFPEAPAEDEDLLLPGAQGAWGNEVPPPAPEPVVETVHEPGPHETAGRDSGAVDLSGVRLPDPAPASVPSSPILSTQHDPTAAPQAARRPLHLGPPVPDASASPVRSLADRGPAGAPARQSGSPAAGPEYLDAQPLRDMAPQSAAPWGAAPAVVPPQPGGQVPATEVTDPAVGPSADAVSGPVDQSGAAQAAVARLATQAAGQVPASAQVVHGHDGAQPAHGHDGVYATPVAQGAEDTQQAPVVAEQGTQPAPAAVGAQAPGSSSVVAEAPVQAGAPVPEAGQAAVQGTPVVAESDQVAEGPGEVQEQVPAQQADPAGQGPVPGAVVQPKAVQEAVLQKAVLQEVVVQEAVVPVTPSEAAPGLTPENARTTVSPDRPHSPDNAGVAEAAQPSEAAPETGQPGVGLEQDAGVRQSTGTPSAVPPPAVTAEAVVAPGPAGTEAAVPVQEAAPALPAEEAAPGEVAAPAVAADRTESVVPAQEAAEAQAGPTPTEPAAAQGPAVAETVQAPGAESVQAPQPAEAPKPVPPAPAPGSQAPEVEAAAASSAPDPVPARPAADGTGTPEADLRQAQGPQSDEPLAPAASVVPGAPQPSVQPVPQDQDAVSVPIGSAPVVHEDAAVPEGLLAQPESVTGPAQSEPSEQSAPAGTAESPVAGLPLEPHPEQPLGQFVPVEGQVPSPPHLAPTPPPSGVLPAQEPQEQVAVVPAPRGAEAVSPVVPPAAAPDAEHAADVVQHAEDLQTRAADQEEGAAEVAEAPQPTGPAAPPYADVEREAVLKVMRERRDIRNGFRGDPIPHEVLLRVLEAAHTAPSVGHSQPWDFVVIRSADTRRAMHELAMRQREAYAKSLPKGRAKQFKELKIEAILDTPVNIVVTADPTRGGRHTLGRHTQPQMAPYSSALAVENLWLAARAEGLGVGWVSFFDEREMVRALGLPEHLEVVAYLCVGYVDEFPDEPELMQAGWSKRRPLSWVVHEETYGRRALPGEEPHDLLAETVAQIRPLDAKALGEAWERQKRMTKPAGALGMLEIISAQLSGLSRQCPPPIPEPAAVAIFAGDHGVHAQGVTPWPQEVTSQMVANFLGGGAVCNAFANQVGAEVCVVDVGVAADLPATPGLLPRKIRGGTSDMTTGPAMTREEAKAAIEVGIETARDLVTAGNKALLSGEMGIANTTASAALISVFTGADPAEVTGRGTGINDETLARKTDVVRRALELHKPDPADPVGVLAAIGGFEHAAMVGLLLGGASLRTPVILDGVSAGAAALVARAIAPEVLAACIAGHRSAEPGHVAALKKLGLRPLVDLDLRLGEGTGALLALPLVQSTARAMREVATFDSAGVTEK